MTEAERESREIVKQYTENTHYVGDLLGFSKAIASALARRDAEIERVISESTNHAVRVDELSTRNAALSEALERIGMLCQPAKLGKPTIEELEKILANENPGKVQMLPNGECVVSDKPEILEIVTNALEGKDGVPSPLKAQSGDVPAHLSPSSLTDRRRLELEVIEAAKLHMQDTAHGNHCTNSCVNLAQKIYALDSLEKGGRT